MKCKHCGSDRVILPFGSFMKLSAVILKTYRCTMCGKSTIVKEKR